MGIYLDSSVIIYAVEGVATFRGLVALQRRRSGVERFTEVIDGDVCEAD